MSSVRESDLMNSVRELCEMFPLHSPQTIERILRSKKGVIDSAISVLLETPADYKDPQPAPPPPPRNVEHKRERAERPKHHKHDHMNHIFPADFLRWPPDAQVICEDIDGNRIDRPSASGVKRPVPMEPEVKPVVRVEVKLHGSDEKPVKGWKKFKARFKKKGKYEKI